MFYLKYYVKRNIHTQIKDWVDTHSSIPILIGPPGCGKSVLLHQLNEEFKNSVYINLGRDEISKLDTAKKYEYISNILDKGNVLLLLDDIHHAVENGRLLKGLYDLYVDRGTCKIVATCSSISDHHMQRTYARMHKMWITHMNFDEYIQSKDYGVEKNFANFEEFLSYKHMYREMHWTDGIRGADSYYALANKIAKWEDGLDPSKLATILKHSTKLFNKQFDYKKYMKLLDLSDDELDSHIDSLQRAQILISAKECFQNGRISWMGKRRMFINPYLHLQLLRLSFEDLSQKQKDVLIAEYIIFESISGQSLYKWSYYSNNKADYSLPGHFQKKDKNKKFRFVASFSYSEKVNWKVLRRIKRLKSDVKEIWCKTNGEKNGIIYKSILNFTTSDSLKREGF